MAEAKEKETVVVAFNPTFDAVLMGAERSDSVLKVIATVREVAGVNGSVSMSVDNLARVGKAVQLTIRNPDTKQVFKIITSSRLSEALRNKEVKLEMIGGFPVVEYTTEQGEGVTIPMVVFPEGSGIEITRDVVTFREEAYVRAYDPKAFLDY